MYIPDKWEIIKFCDNKKTWFKVLASWYGGYMDCENYRLSSGLVDIIDNPDYYLMKNISGSEYKCYKNQIGLINISNSVLNRLQNLGKENNINIEICSIDEFQKHKEKICN